MKHFGPSPPWTGESFHYGRWIYSGQLWDNTKVWEWHEPRSNYVQILTNVFGNIRSLGVRKIEWLEDELFATRSLTGGAN